MSDTASQPQLSDRLKAQLPMAQAWIHDTVRKPDSRLIELLDERKEGFTRSLHGVTPGQAAFVPGEGQWCIDEVLRHLAHTNDRVAGLIEALASGYVPGGSAVAGYVPRDDRDFEHVKADLLASFETLRGVFNVVTDSGADLVVKYKHPFFGELNAREWFVFNFVHASVHIQQVERIKASPGFAAA